MNDRLFDLSGNVAIVTGSTKGIGRAIASGLARAGANVVVSSRKQDLCEKVASEIEEETGVPTLGLACHVGDWDSIPTFVDQVQARLGHIDILVNNAGITPTRETPSEISLDVWRKIFSVNVEGPLRMAQCVVPVMREHGGGSIINIASMAAYSGGTVVCAYGASKAALVNLTKSQAQEFVAWNIRVNVLSPGPFLSEMVEGAERNAPGFKDLIAGGTLMQRIAEPEEIVGPVLYLASDASSFVTGDDISVSGGMQK